MVSLMLSHNYSLHMRRILVDTTTIESHVKGSTLLAPRESNIFLRLFYLCFVRYLT